MTRKFPPVNPLTGRRRSWREFVPLIVKGVRDAARRVVDPLGNIVSRRQRDQLKFAAGKRKIVSLEKRAATNPLGRSQAARTAFGLKRREAALRKAQYGGQEKIKDIERFESLKEKFNANTEHTPGLFKPGEYEFMRAFAEKHRDLDEDFASKLYPPRLALKKRRGHGRVDPKGRPYRQPSPRSRTAHRKVA